MLFYVFANPRKHCKKLWRNPLVRWDEHAKKSVENATSSLWGYSQQHPLWEAYGFSVTRSDELEEFDLMRRRLTYVGRFQRVFCRVLFPDFAGDVLFWAFLGGLLGMLVFLEQILGLSGFMAFFIFLWGFWLDLVYWWVFKCSNLLT